jgi:hypothetical protein
VRFCYVEEADESRLKLAPGLDKRWGGAGNLDAPPAQPITKKAPRAAYARGYAEMLQDPLHNHVDTAAVMDSLQRALAQVFPHMPDVPLRILQVAWNARKRHFVRQSFGSVTTWPTQLALDRFDGAPREDPGAHAQAR